MTPPERVRFLRREHYRTDYPVACCHKDHQNWPCSVIQALDAGAAVERERIVKLLDAAGARYQKQVGCPAKASDLLREAQP